MFQKSKRKTNTQKMSFCFTIQNYILIFLDWRSFDHFQYLVEFEIHSFTKIILFHYYEFPQNNNY